MTRPQVQNVSRLSTPGTGSRAFNASNQFPPDAMVATAVMMDHTPATSYFLPTLPGSRGKVRGSLATSGEMSRQAPPRGTIVSSSSVFYGAHPYLFEPRGHRMLP